MRRTWTAAVTRAFIIVAAEFCLGTAYRLINGIPLAAVLTPEVLALAAFSFAAISVGLFLGWARAPYHYKARSIRALLASIFLYLLLSASLFSCVLLLKALISTRILSLHYVGFLWPVIISGVTVGVAAHMMPKRS